MTKLAVMAPVEAMERPASLSSTLASIAESTTAWPENLAFMADAQTAGLVVGARVPLILTSRADAAPARIFSAAAAVLYADALARDPKILLPDVAE